MTAVKICGINDSAAFDAAIDAGADWLGFAFFAASPRHVTPAQAQDLSARRPGGPGPAGPGRVGLFVAPSDAEVAACLDQMKLDALQIYSPAVLVAEFRTRF